MWKKKISYASRQKIAQERQRVNGKFIASKKIQNHKLGLDKVENGVDLILSPPI